MQFTAPITAAFAAAALIALTGCATAPADSPAAPSASELTTHGPHAAEAKTADSRDLTIAGTSPAFTTADPSFATDDRALERSGWTLEQNDSEDLQQGGSTYRHAAGVTVRLERVRIANLRTGQTDQDASEAVLDADGILKRSTVQHVRRSGGGQVDFLTAIPNAALTGPHGTRLSVRAFPQSKVLLRISASGPDQRSVDRLVDELLNDVSVLAE